MVRSAVISTLAVVLGLCLGLLIGWLSGENPIHVLNILINGAFGSWTNLGYSLYYATPLIFTGLAVSWALKAGLFNIGAEGQMIIGGISACAFAIHFPNLPSPLSLIGSLTVAFLAGGIWGGIAGALKAYRGCHEVLATILLNFTAYGIAGYLVNHVYRNPDSQAPETYSISNAYHLNIMSWLGADSPLNTSLIISLILLIAYFIFMSKTIIGFRLRMSGDSPGVAIRSGINLSNQILLALFVSGGLAGMASSSEIFGFAHKAREGFSSGAGFTGIAVALVGRLHPVGIFLAALLFGALHKGSLDLDIDTKFISRDLSQVIQALIILFVVCEQGLIDLKRRLS